MTLYTKRKVRARFPRSEWIPFYRYLAANPRKHCATPDCIELAESGQLVCWKCDAVFNSATIDTYGRYLDLLRSQ